MIWLEINGNIFSSWGPAFSTGLVFRGSIFCQVQGPGSFLAYRWCPLSTIFDKFSKFYSAHFFSMTASKFSFRKNPLVVNWLLCKPTLFLGRLNHITFPSLRTIEQLLTTRNGSLRWEKGKAWEKHLAFSSLKPCTCTFSKSYL